MIKPKQCMLDKCHICSEKCFNGSGIFLEKITNYGSIIENFKNDTRILKKILFCTKCFKKINNLILKPIDWSTRLQCSICFDEMKISYYIGQGSICLKLCEKCFTKQIGKHYLFEET